MIKRENDNIGKYNQNSVINLLSNEEVNYKAKATGVFERRTLKFDIDIGCIYYTMGD